MPVEPAPATPSTPAAVLAPEAVAISLAKSKPLMALTELTLVLDKASIIPAAIAAATGETDDILDKEYPRSPSAEPVGEPEDDMPDPLLIPSPPTPLLYRLSPPLY
jgi:hypothetical protein